MIVKDFGALPSYMVPAINTQRAASGEPPLTQAEINYTPPGTPDAPDWLTGAVNSVRNFVTGGGARDVAASLPALPTSLPFLPSTAGGGSAAGGGTDDDSGGWANAGGGASGLFGVPKMVLIAGGAVLVIGVGAYVLTRKPKRLAGYRRRRKARRSRR
jgi:hypothetical protein